MNLTFTLVCSLLIQTGIAAVSSNKSNPNEIAKTRLSPASAPASTPAPKVKIGKIQTTPLKPIKQITIAPKDNDEAKHANDPAYFSLRQSGKDLYLRFVTKDPKLKLSVKDSMMIQIITDPPMRVQPAYIFSQNWPANSNEIKIQASNPYPKLPNRVLGKASFTYCHADTKDCKKALTSMEFYYTATNKD